MWLSRAQLLERLLIKLDVKGGEGCDDSVRRHHRVLASAATVPLPPHPAAAQARDAGELQTQDAVHGGYEGGTVGDCGIVEFSFYT